MKKLALLCFLLFCVPFFSEITVEVASNEEIKPSYLFCENSTHSNLMKGYSDILKLDLNLCGYTYVSERAEFLDEKLSQEEVRNAFDPFFWRKHNFISAIKVQYEHNRLVCDALSLELGRVHRFVSAELTLNLEQDRETLHKLSDQIFHYLFHKKGIATKKIAFALQKKIGEEKWSSRLIICDYDGARAHFITPITDYAISPVWANQNQSIFFVSYRNGPPKLFQMDLNNKISKPVIELRGNQLLPAISANEKFLAFISDVCGRSDLFLQNLYQNKAVGKPMQVYSVASSVQASPTMSPDGKFIAFVSDKAGTPRVYCIETPKYSRQNVLPEAKIVSHQFRENTSPAWSPDGKKIAYSARIEGVRQIVVFDLATKEEIPLTRGPMHKENPAWAPNSEHIVYNTADGETSDIYMVHIHQQKAFKITSGPGKKHYPSWEK